MSSSHATTRPDLLTIHQAGYFSPVPRYLHIDLRYPAGRCCLDVSFGNDVVFVSVSTLERPGGQQEQEKVNKSFSTTLSRPLRPRSECRNRAQPAQPINSTLMQAAQRPGTGQGVVPSLCSSLGFPFHIKVELQRRIIYSLLRPCIRSSGQRSQ